MRTNANTNIPDNGFINTFKLNVIALYKLTIDNLRDFSLNKNINICIFLYENELLLRKALSIIKKHKQLKKSKINLGYTTHNLFIVVLVQIGVR